MDPFFIAAGYLLPLIAVAIDRRKVRDELSAQDWWCAVSWPYWVLKDGIAILRSLLGR